MFLSCVSDMLPKHHYLGALKIINSLHIGCYYLYNVFSIKIEVSIDLKMPRQGIKGFLT